MMNELFVAVIFGLVIGWLSFGVVFYWSIYDELRKIRKKLE